MAEQKEKVYNHHKSNQLIHAGHENQARTIFNGNDSSKKLRLWHPINQQKDEIRKTKSTANTNSAQINTISTSSSIHRNNQDRRPELKKAREEPITERRRKGRCGGGRTDLELGRRV